MHHGKLGISFVVAVASLVCGAPLARASLVAYYNLNGNINDSTTNANNGLTLFGGSFDSNVPPKLGTGSSLSMVGGEGVVTAGFDVPGSASLDLTSEGTISAWLNMTDRSTYYFIAVKGPSGTAGNHFPGNFEFRVESGSGLLNFLHQTFEGATLSAYTSTAAVPTGQWTHVAVTAKNGGNVTFYVNGQAAGNSATQGTFGVANTNSMFVGTRLDVFSGFNGGLDDLAIWNNTLSAGQIAALANGASPTNLPNFNPADMNLDGAVNDLDYFALRDNFGTGIGLGEGDINGDGQVNGVDFRILKNNYTPGGALSPVPEPKSLMLLCLGVAGLTVARRRLRRESPLQTH